MLLSTLSLRHASEQNSWPFDLPALRGLGQMKLSAAVTIFVGENGSGKSTLLESLARKAEMPSIGCEDASRDDTLSHLDAFCQSLRLGWRKRAHRGFFLRAEDFFAYSRRLQVLAGDLQQIVDGYERELRQGEGENVARDQGIKRAMGFVRGQKDALICKYGENPDARSHGESFLSLLQERLAPGGLYLLDEPEAALSPLRQLALMTMLKAAVEDGSQFILATHSPILMAFPGAEILDFNSSPINPIEYEEIEHVQLMRSFLRDPGAFTCRL
jgi:predicted ATPase